MAWNQSMGVGFIEKDSKKFDFVRSAMRMAMTKILAPLDAGFNYKFNEDGEQFGVSALQFDETDWVVGERTLRVSLHQEYMISIFYSSDKNSNNLSLTDKLIDVMQTAQRQYELQEKSQLEATATA